MLFQPITLNRKRNQSVLCNDHLGDSKNIRLVLKKLSLKKISNHEYGYT